MGTITLDMGPVVDVMDYLASRFVGRDREIVALLAGLVSGEPVFLCGPPGTTKTRLIEELAKCVSARFFRFDLTRHTEPDELLGPYDIAALREGKLRRITAGRLPEAEIVFLDEVFKGSSAIRHILLDAILNKRFFDGTEYRPLPMLTLFTASNEVSTDSEDAAFYDRLLIRSFLDSVPDELLDELVLKGAELTFGGDSRGRPRPLTVDYIRLLQQAAKVRALSIARNEKWRGKIVEAVVRLRQKKLWLSDRRIVKIALVMSAVSLVYAEQEPSLDSLADALRFTAPSEPEDVATVEEVIKEMNISQINLTKYYTLLEEAKTLTEELEEELRRGKVSPATLGKLEQVREKLVSLNDSIPQTPRTEKMKRKLEEAIHTVETALKGVE